MKDIDIIKKIDEISLSENELTELADIEEIGKTPNSYVLSEQNRVIGLSLTDYGIKHITEQTDNSKSSYKLFIYKLSPEQFDNIQELIYNLTELKKLIFQGGVDCPSPTRILPNIKNLRKLECLDISFNDELSILPNEISELTELKELDVDVTNFTEFPSVILNLKKLEKLSLSGSGYIYDSFLNRSKIENIPDLRTLNKLTYLKLYSSSLKEIPKQLPGSLKELNLGLNFIETIPEDLTFPKNLLDLIISDNQIKDISPLLPLLKKDEFTLSVYSNPLKYPPYEIVNIGNKAIVDWIISQKTLNNDIKLILVGNTTSGKTSLINYLTKREYSAEIKSTHGIVLTNWKYEDKNINIWDFGGQEYYHATHKLFLTTNSIYILLWTKEHNHSGFLPTNLIISEKHPKSLKNLQHFNNEYWCRLIRKYDNYNRRNFDDIISPIFLVQNKIDIDKADEIELSLREKYNIGYHFYISIRNSFLYKEKKTIEFEEFYEDFQFFKKKLLRTIIKSIKEYEIQSYIKEIRDAIRNIKNKNVVSFDNYKNICQTSAKSKISEEQIEIATHYLNNSGVITYFGYQKNIPNNSILKTKVIVNPNYITSLIYKILNIEVKNNNGLFDFEHVINITKDESEAHVFIDMMKSPNFELIFEYPSNSGRYYAPQYLPEMYQGDSELFNIILSNLFLSLSIQFCGYFSNNIMTKFITRYGVFSENKSFWKNGILFKKNNIQFYVENNFEKQIINIYSNISNKNNTVLTEVIKKIIDYEDEKEIKVSIDEKTYIPLVLIKDNKKHTHFSFKNSSINIEPFDCLIDVEKKQILNNLKSNYISVDGKGNVIIQDINSSNVTVHYSDLEQIKKIIERYNSSNEDEYKLISNKMSKLIIDFEEATNNQKSMKEIAEIVNNYNNSLNNDIEFLNKNLIDIKEKLDKLIENN